MCLSQRSLVLVLLSHAAASSFLLSHNLEVLESTPYSKVRGYEKKCELGPGSFYFAISWYTITVIGLNHMHCFAGIRGSVTRTHLLIVLWLAERC